MSLYAIGLKDATKATIKSFATADGVSYIEFFDTPLAAYLVIRERKYPNAIVVEVEIQARPVELDTLLDPDFVKGVVRVKEE